MSKTEPPTDPDKKPTENAATKPTTTKPTKKVRIVTPPPKQGPVDDGSKIHMGKANSESTSEVSLGMHQECTCA